MAKVVVLLRVLPEDVETSPQDILEGIRAQLPSKYEVVKHEVEPIAFGLRALKLTVFMPEEHEGGTEELERLISEVQGVSQVDVLAVSRLST